MNSGTTSAVKPLKLALFGFGKMGKMVEQKASSRGHSVGAIVDRSSRTSPQKLAACDVVIDFTAPEAVLENVKRAAGLKKSIVIGTTGWQEHLPEVKSIAEREQIGVLFSPNFSIGVHLFFKLVEEASRLLSAIEGYDVAGVELHHHQKADSPSGTARALAEIILSQWKSKKSTCYGNPKGKIPEDALHFASMRAGFFAGTHTLYFDSAHDTITLTHEAKGREGFAHGAVLAAEWLFGKTGFYTLEDTL